jgi:PHD/YefM family antitoxin component YafN of YafNO toxin-antitoxin module
MENRFLTRVTVSDLQANASAVLAEVRAAKAPTAILEGEQPAVVLMSLVAFEKAEEETRILKRLAKGELEIAAGTGHELAEVLADADRILASYAS